MCVLSFSKQLRHDTLVGSTEDTRIYRQQLLFKYLQYLKNEERKKRKEKEKNVTKQGNILSNG